MKPWAQISLPAIGRITLRALGEHDQPLFREFLDHVTREDLRLRFFAAMYRVNDRLIEQLTHPDPQKTLVLVAIEDATQHVIGVARLHVDADNKAGEYAVLVRSALKGRGLGWILMKHVIEYGRATGLENIHGFVLAENIEMLQMCRELGFTIEHDAGDPGIRVVRIQLQNELLKHSSSQARHDCTW